MKFTPNNKQGYLQVIISILLILLANSYKCFYKVHIVSEYHEYTDHLGLDFINSFFLTGFSYASSPREHLFYAFAICILFVFLLVNLANIFFQAKNKNKTVSIITASTGLITIIALDVIVRLFARKIFNIDSDEKYEIRHGIEYYYMVILLIAQFVLTWLPNTAISRLYTSVSKFFHDTPCDNAAPSPQPNKNAEINILTTKDERDEIRLLEKEYRELKEKIELIEKEKQNKAKMKIEKENLANEIAKLKEILKNSQNDPE